MSTQRSGRVDDGRRVLKMTLARGTYRFQVRTRNAIGRSPMSLQSNAVVAR